MTQDDDKLIEYHALYQLEITEKVFNHWGDYFVTYYIDMMQY